MTSPGPNVHLVARNDQVAVWQAQGILMEVLGCNAREAADLIHKRSIANGRRTRDTADAIVSTGDLLAG
jgi:AmiR/NasT family two-component response regulator